MDRTDPPAPPGGTKDGCGASDHDEPYQFGRRPRAIAPWPFTERQYAQLLVLRGRVQDAVFEADDRRDSHPIAFLDDGVWVASRADLLADQSAPERRAA
jgi:hypothetical protein